MNNCPKCGNPLQAGITSCPICGTNVASDNNTAQPSNNVVVNSVAKPVAQEATAPVQNETTQPVNVNNQVQTENKSEVVVEPVSAPNVQTTAPVVPANAAVDSVPTPQVQTPVVEPVQAPTPEQNTTQQPAPVTEQASVVQTPASPATNVVSDQNSAPQTIQSAPVAPTNVSAIAPTVAPIDTQSPIPSIPSSLSGNNTTVVTAPAQVNAPAQAKQKPKKKGSKGSLAIILVVLLLVVGGVLYMTMGKSLKPNVPAPAPEEEIATTSVTSNGYKFALPEGWLINEDGTNVILTNSSETVAIKLDHSTSNIQNISKEMIESFLKNGSYEDSEVTELSISAKDAYSINAKVNNLPVQIYFIGGGSNLTLGVTIVYQSEDSKSKYEADITEMIGTIAYSDESIKAISTMDMYSDIFNIYRGVVNESNKPQPETPNVENNEENKEDETNNENGETNNTEQENNNTVTPAENNPETPTEPTQPTETN